MIQRMNVEGLVHRTSHGRVAEQLDQVLLTQHGSACEGVAEWKACVSPDVSRMDVDKKRSSGKIQDLIVRAHMG
jgi:hypothetical protein